MAVAPAVPEAFVIEGGAALSGRIRTAGNKNGALPILAATLLADEPVTLSNVPRIRDVETMIELLNGLGADAEWTGANDVHVDASGLSSYEVDPELAERIRASFLLAGPLLARVGRASVPHIQDLCRFLVSLGAEIEGIESNVLRVRGVEGLRGGDWRICPEHIEVGSFIGLAAVTGSDVTIEDVQPNDLVSIIPAFERLGVHVEIHGTTLRVPP